MSGLNAVLGANGWVVPEILNPAVRLSPYLAPVSTGTFVYDTAHASNTFGYMASPHTAHDDIRAFQLEFANWRTPTGGGVETNGGGDCTWTASVEYPAGTRTQFKFSGSSSGVVSPGSNLLTDFLPINIPDGSKFWIHCWQSWAGSGRVQYFQYYCGDGTAKYAFGTTIGAVPDITMSGSGSLTTAPASGSPYSGPLNILAYTTKPTLGIQGNSISIGRGDSGDASGRQGYIARAFGGQFAYTHAGVSGDTLAGFIASNTKRRASLNRCSHIAMEPGINDVGGGASAATVLTNTNTIIGYFPGKRVAVFTLLPYVTGTFADAAGQTVTANEAVRLVVNAQRRNGLTAAHHIYDVERAAESSYLSGKWQSILGTISPATAGYTADGVHPSQTGCIAIANSINTAAFMGQ